jgi:hypothetical protein
MVQKSENGGCTGIQHECGDRDGIKKLVWDVYKYINMGKYEGSSCRE